MRKMREMRNCVLVALLLSATVTAGAQEKLSPKVNSLKATYIPAATTRAASQENASAERAGFIVTCDPAKSAAAIANQMKALGAEVNALLGNQLVVSLPLSQIDAAATIDGVLLIDIPSGSIQKTDITRQVTHAKEVIDGTGEKLPQAYTGKGVVIGVIDGGFDYTHPVFKDKDGKLRIKAVYLPAEAVAGGETLSNILVTDDKGVTTSLTLPGTLVTNADVILDTLRMKDLGYHGTHCAAIAAGSTMPTLKGLGGGNLGGMAPEADIVLSLDDVPLSEILRVGPLGELERTGYYKAMGLYALKAYADKQGKPLVISVSTNNHEGFHDGTSSQARYIGNFCKAGNVMALCASNEGAERLYVERQVNAGKTLDFWISQKSTTAKMDALMKTSKEVKATISVVDCNNEFAEVYKANLLLTTDPTKVAQDNKRVYMEWGLGDNLMMQYNCLTTAQNAIARKLSDYFGSGRIDITLTQGTALGQDNQPFSYACFQLFAPSLTSEPNMDGSPHYCLQVSITPSEDVTLYAWSDAESELLANSMEQPNFFKPATNEVCIGDMNTSGEAVTIGAWVANNKVLNTKTGQLEDTNLAVGAIAPFSSFGYDITKTRTYPDVTTPGFSVLSAMNSFDNPKTYVSGQFSGQFAGQKSPRTYGFQFASGTSMATPAAAGIFALWLQAAKDKGKTLTNKDIKDIIAATSDTDQFSEASPLCFGKGKLNAYKGLLYVLDLATGIDGLSQHQPEGVSFRLTDGKLIAEGAEDGTPVSLYSLQGVCVGRTTVEGGAISLEGLPSGVYAVQLGKLGSTLIRL